jgi:arabinofuranan 3-O-arabinosyltransferase
VSTTTGGEVGPGAAGEEQGARRLRSGLRLVATCVALAGLALAQSPGFLVADTKFDLALAPDVFLSRATHLWDPLAAGGQLQNQAYGYLWPMGPFYWLGHVLDVPGWAVQRLWLALVLCVAFLGAARLARALGVRSDLACILGGLAYALSPRMLTVLGPISIEAWPSALAPWVLLPLVIGSRRGSPRRAAAFSALAVAMVGGVNAVATFAVIPLGVLWLLTRSPGPRRRSMMTWWPVFVAVGTAWWLVPLFVLGTYSPPFLDFIESAANTTFPTTLFDSLRGTSNWVPYVDRSSRAGNDLVRLFHLPLLSGVVLLLGLAGLLHPRNKHRLFLGLGVAGGLLMVTAGHLGNVQGWGATGLHSLLDGSLAPLRNVHKFDPIVRLPLVIGLAWTVDLLWGTLREQGRGGLTDLELGARRASLRILIGTAVVAVLAASMPAFTGRITPAASLLSVPDYWKEAAGWLADSSEQGQALLVPGSSFGTYVWGSPRDEPMQYLARTKWGVRNAVPLTPPGNIRMLDAIEARFAQGEGSSGLATYLRRAGISHLLVRNDLARIGDIPDPVLVHQAIERSPGLRRVATFGPDIGGEAHLDKGAQRILVNGGWQSRYPAVEVFQVAGTSAYAAQSQSPPTVVGGPEDLLDLADLGVLGDEPTVLANDAAPQAGPDALVLTDGLRAVERNFGRVHDGASETLVTGQTRRLARPTRDYLLPHQGRWSTTATLRGAAAVTASSSMSDASALGVEQGGEQPYAAIDGRPETRWSANYRPSETAWWQVDLEAPRAVATVRLTAGPGDREVVRVVTDHASVRSVVLEAGTSRTVRLDEPSTRKVRVVDDSGRSGNRLTLAEVEVPGVKVTRVLRLPSLPASWGTPDDIVLRAVADARRGCAVVDGDTRCVADREVASEEDYEVHRELTLGEPASYAATIRAEVRPGPALARKVFEGQPVNVNASSEGTSDPRTSVLSAVDGDVGTTWTAASTDSKPVLTLNWLDRRRVTGLQLTVSADTAARTPTELTLSWPGGRRDVRLRKDGTVRFPAIRTKELAIQVQDAEDVRSLGFDSSSSSVPIGITELRVTGLPYLPVAIPTNRMRLPCGAGPTLSINGTPQQTSVTASLADLAARQRVTAQMCGSTAVRLRSGANDVDLVASELFVPRSVVLSTGPRVPAVTGLEGSGDADPSRRSVQPVAPDGLLVLRQNVNKGWKATRGNTTLVPAVVDGWQQAWHAGPGDGPVTLTFGPDRFYRGALLGGLVALFALMLLTLLPLRWWRRLDDASLHGRTLPPPVLAVVGLVASGLLAGWTGVVIGVVALAGASVLQRRWPMLAPWLLGALVIPSALAYALRPWGGEGAWAGSSAWPHYLVVLVVAALCARPLGMSFLVLRPFRRRAGRSTKR